MTDYDDEAVPEEEPSLDEQMATLPPKVVELLADMYDEVQQLRAAQAPDTSEFEPPEITPLPEGTRRYVNTQYTEETLIRTPGKKILYDGEMINVPQVDVTFSGRLYTSSDPEEQAFIETHAAYGVRIYRDDTARPDPRLPGLTTGARGTDATPRANPLAAPMG